MTLWTLDALSLQALKMLRVDVYVENDRKALSEDLITLISELGYDMWRHLPELYNPNNFAQNKVNVFARIVSVNLLCFPTEAGENIAGLRRVAGPKDWWQDQPLKEARGRAGEVR